jgi:hypothetical protein
MIQPIKPELQHQPIWFFAIGSQRKGPYAIDQINGMVEEGTISRTTLVWTKGMPQWEVAESTELATCFNQPPSLSTEDISKDAGIDGTTAKSVSKIPLTESDCILRKETNKPTATNAEVNEKYVFNKNLRRSTWWTQGSPVFKLFIISVVVGIAIFAIASVFGFPIAAASTIGRTIGAFILPCILISLVNGVAIILKKKIPYGFQYFAIGGFGLLFTLLSIFGNDGEFNIKNMSAMWAPFAVGIVLLVHAFNLRQK